MQIKSSKWLHVLLPHAVLTVAIVLIGIPLYCAVIVSTQTVGETLNNPLLPGTGLIGNIEHALSRNLGGFTLNSVLVSIAITLSKTILSLMAGLAFTFFGFRGKWILLGMILLTLLVPEDVLVIALFRLVSGTLNLGNTFAGVVLPALASAYGAFLFHQHFLSIPAELSEAAQLEGMNPIQYLQKILIPLSWNTIGAFFVVIFNGSWNMYMWPLMIITNPDNQVIQVGLRMIRGAGESSQQWGPLMLGAVLASAPPLAVFLVLQRQLVTGFAFAQDK